MKTNKNIEGWEKSFDKQFDSIFAVATYDEFRIFSKQFIRNLLSAQRANLVKEIEVFEKHCEKVKPQNKCSTCIVLGDLKLKLNQ